MALGIVSQGEEDKKLGQWKHQRSRAAKSAEEMIH